MSASTPNSESNWVDPDDAPEWTDEMFDRAELRIGDTVIRRARPPGLAKTPTGLDQDPSLAPPGQRRHRRLPRARPRLAIAHERGAAQGGGFGCRKLVHCHRNPDLGRSTGFDGGEVDPLIHYAVDRLAPRKIVQSL